MHERNFNGTNRPVSEMGLGCWQLGGSDWGALDDATALDILRTAADAGTTFFDTADVYGGGRSEKTHRPVPQGRRRAEGNLRRHQARARPRHVPQRLHGGHRAPRDGSLPPTPRRRCPRPYATALRPGGRHPPGGNLRLAAPTPGRGQNPRVRRERGDRRGSLAVHGAGWAEFIADHLQPLPPETRDGGVPRGEREERRHHRAPAAGERAAERQDEEGHDLRRERPPHLQPRWEGVQRRRNLRRAAVRKRRRTGRRARFLRARRHEHGAMVATLDSRPRRRDGRHSRREPPGAGRGQRRRVEPAAALRASARNVARFFTATTWPNISAVPTDERPPRNPRVNSSCSAGCTC